MGTPVTHRSCLLVWVGDVRDVFPPCDHLLVALMVESAATHMHALITQVTKIW